MTKALGLSITATTHGWMDGWMDGYQPKVGMAVEGHVGNLVRLAALSYKDGISMRRFS